MYIIQNGKRIPLDVSMLTDDELDNISLTRPAIINSDEFGLVDIWVATFERRIIGSTNTSERYEFVGEKDYDHNPTQDELIEEIGRLGLGRYSVVTVQQGKELNFLN